MLTCVVQWFGVLLFLSTFLLLLIIRPNDLKCNVTVNAALKAYDGTALNTTGGAGGTSANTTLAIATYSLDMYGMKCPLPYPTGISFKSRTNAGVPRPLPQREP